MSKAIITSGGKQYIVSEGDVISLELLGTEDKQITFQPLAIIDGNKTTVGSPTVSGASVTAEVMEEFLADKVTSIRYKAKKRVHKLRGHRQHLQSVKITKIG
jgi:large subunit ribosomal protein L21